MLLGLSNICGASVELINALPIQAVESVYPKLGVIKYNKPIHAVQSLYHGTTTSIFSPDFIPTTRKIIDNISKNDAYIATLGSPSVRNEGRSNKQLANAALMYLGRYAETKNVTLCLEPIAKQYGAKFLTRVEEIAAIANQFSSVESNPFCITFDIGNIWLEEGNNIFNLLEKHINLIGHVHVSATNLQPIHKETDIPYEEIFACLKKLRYYGVASIEMLPCSEDDIKKSVEMVGKLL